MRRMKLRLDPQDEYMHPLEAASNFNESMYFNVYDPGERDRRLPPARQPRQRGLRRADDVPLPPRRPGRRSCSPGPRSRTTTRSTRAARASRSSRRSRSCARRTTARSRCSTEPLQMANPRKAFTENPWVDAHVDLDAPRRVTDVRRRAGERRRLAAHRGPLRRVRPRPLRAAHGGRRARSASATRSGRSTASACATTRGVRASGRRRGGTAGSPRTSATTSASWCRSSRRATAAGAIGGMVLARRRVRAHRRTRRSRPTGTATTSTTQEMRATATTGDRHLRDHRAACSTSSRCATAARHPRASSS